VAHKDLPQRTQRKSEGSNNNDLEILALAGMCQKPERKRGQLAYGALAYMISYFAPSPP